MGENHRHSKWPQQRALHSHQGGGEGDDQATNEKEGQSKQKSTPTMTSPNSPARPLSGFIQTNFLLVLKP